jgi:hypothetical protein
VLFLLLSTLLVVNALGVTLAQQSGTNILLVISAVFVSGAFGAFASPLGDHTVTLCVILSLR